jgi:uncharacterized protein GlcG (DUF336 family)
MTNLTLDIADKMIVAAFSKGAELQLKPLCVAVLDPGGHVIALARQDGASNMRPQIATAKASGALALGISSRKIAEMAADRPTFVAALAPLAVNGILPAAGGVIIMSGSGEIAGAIGITGDTSDNDEGCALAAISSVRLMANT